MTYYGRSNESQRNDVELHEAISKELKNLEDIVGEIQTKLHAISGLILEGIEIEEMDLGRSSVLRQTNMHVNAALSALYYVTKWNLSAVTDVKSIAAYMSEGVAEELKEKHCGG